jgi:alkanesulfonate monooxygenase SsuD/methylene tetrahydromethanopterin reductase-like flavin-dependent oxidoreductase (luciferase family)
MIGGEGEKRTLRLVARYADACNFHLGTHPKLRGYVPASYERYTTRLERIGHKLRVLERHCRRAGRDPAEIEVSLLSPLELGPGAMDAGDVLEMCEELAGAGVQHLIFNMPNDYEIAPLEALGRDVIPRVRAL